ncbi:DgyrCDS10272 [Dimorphilus gyrociliatus]|uniref:carbonic anhydrase n=1 Tax=Dimorphilus gyrociliatus TaxID=2664684 RepID=A0A7I8W0V6_9ANNE|nr:DgyrCDS10272 [Dimorphilus gyrociliatus]
MKLYSFLTIVGIFIRLNAYQFNYKKEGSDWKGTCANGEKQSPINIKEEEAFNLQTPPLKFHNIKKYLKGSRLINNGKTVRIHNQLEFFHISNGGLPGKYSIKYIDFHWGKGKGRGSEHRLSGISSDMEMQIVATKIGGKVKDLNYYAIFAFLFEAFPGTANDLPGALLDAFKNVKQVGKSRLISPITFKWLIGKQLGEFYRYKGSLTSPPCSENAIWTIFRKKRRISLFIKKVLNSIQLKKHEVANFRKIQPLNGRKVYKRVKKR